MIIDTSALIAILRDEPEAEACARAIEGLNFGDCFDYALARASNEPLLFKGEDFSHTDIISALA